MGCTAFQRSANGKCGFEKGLYSSNLISALITLSRGREILSANAYPVNIRAELGFPVMP
jgi:hypothetical protein